MEENLPLMEEKHPSTEEKHASTEENPPSMEENVAPNKLTDIKQTGENDEKHQRLRVNGKAGFARR